uniref:Uncharacterized protein n=1 Tax=Escherichia coli TaxID=562 RepID=A0A3G4RXS5_ECOLX|nr:hypothetical protein D0362_00244 [Escherichia coli]
MIFARFHALNVQQLHHGFAVRSPLKRLRNRDRMCKCNTVTRDDIPFAIWFRASPRHPRIQCVRASMWFPVLFRFLAHSLTNVRSLGCGERCHLSHVSVIPLLSFGDKSSDSPSNALRSSQTHETGFKCPSGHGRREKRLQSVSGGQARRYP